MKYITKVVLIGFIAAAIVLSGCSKIKEIKISEDVKTETLAKVEDNKIRSEPVLKKKLDGLENQRVLSWVDDENILTVNPEATLISGGKVILSSYNLESGESKEILNDSNITRLLDYRNGEGLVLLGSSKKAFVYDPKEKKLEEVLDIDKEFKDGMPGSKRSKEEQDILGYSVKLIKPNYISYASKIISRDASGLADKAEYTILNYNEHKKYTTQGRYAMAGFQSSFDLTDRNIYIADIVQNKIIRLNLETREELSMELSKPRISKVFEDGTLFVESTEESNTGSNIEKWYKVDFDKKEITPYYENYEIKKVNIEDIDFKNEFIGYSYTEENGEEIPMYGRLEGNKFILKDKLFKNNEDEGCNTREQFIFSPDHNKFITGVAITDWQSEEAIDKRLKDDKYLFELQ